MEAAGIRVEHVIAMDLFRQRVPRRREPTDEARAIDDVRRALSGSPRAVLQALAQAALALCRAQSAGVSLLEEKEGRRFFRWHAVAGAWGHLMWNTLPREFSPCGTVLDHDATLFMIDPERHYTGLSQVPPRVAEALLVPFALAGKTVGTVWVVAHDSSGRFDLEDQRILGALTVFAAASLAR